MIGKRLSPGDPFPALRARHDAKAFDALEYLSGHWGVVLVYRGDWCPFCRAQLSNFQRHISDFERTGVRVLAISVDSEADATAMVKRSQLTFPVLYAADPDWLAKNLGAYVSDDAHGRYVNSTAFILDPKERVVLAVYSSGAVGRLVAEDALGLIGYLQKQPAPALTERHAESGFPVPRGHSI